MKISKSGIAPLQQIKSEHLTRIIDAISGETPNTTIEVSGSVTASFFVGDGSHLTNLPIPSGSSGSFDTSSLVSKTTFNNFTSSYNTGSFTGSFKGDGSHLTGLPVDVLSAKTGSIITFIENSVYNETNPLTGSLTLDMTNQISGKVSIVYHKSSTFPTITIPVTNILFYNVDDYVPDNTTINVMYFIVMPTGNISLTTKQYTGAILTNTAEIQAIINAANTAGDVLPTSVFINKLNIFVNNLKNIRNDANTLNDNLLNYIDLLEVYVTSQREFSKYNIITGTKIAANVNGTPIFNNSGFKAASTSNYLTVGGNVKSTVTKMTLNNASVYVYQNGATITGFFCGVIDFVDNTKRIYIGNILNTGSQLALNSNHVTNATLPLPNGGVLLDRINSSGFDVYINGVSDGNIVAVSTDIPNNPMAVCARNSGASPLSSDGVISLIMYGKSIRDFQANFHQLVQNLM